jgi:hypothetical protein
MTIRILKNADTSYHTVDNEHKSINLSLTKKVKLTQKAELVIDD